MRISRAALVLIVALLGFILSPTPVIAQDGHGETTAAGQETHGEETHGEEGAHGDDHGGKASAIAPATQGIVSAITTIIVFLIVVAVLARTVWPRITKGLEERAAKIREEILAAERAREDQKAALEQYEKSLAEAKAESKRMLDETKQYQQQLAADLRSKADAELAQLKDRARRDIEAAKKTAITEIYSEATGLAHAMASRILERQVNDEDHAKLLDEALAELPKVKN